MLDVKSIPPEIGWYLAGFTDGEGSFNVSFRPRPDYRMPWKVSLCFNISQRDAVILSQVKKWLECGTMRQRRDGVWYYEVNNLNAIAMNVIPFFERFGFLSAKKKRDFLKFKELARILVTEPDHRGIAKLLRRVLELQRGDDDFRGIHIDGRFEFLEAAQLDGFDDCEEALVEITRRRTHVPQPIPSRAISTVHKAKGFECGAVCLVDCDGKSFPDSREARCVLYVALSRATSRLQLVVSEKRPSPLLRL